MEQCADAINDDVHVRKRSRTAVTCVQITRNVAAAMYSIHTHEQVYLLKHGVSRRHGIIRCYAIKYQQSNNKPQIIRNFKNK